MKTPYDYRHRNRLPMLLAGLTGSFLFITVPVFLLMLLTGVSVVTALVVSLAASLLLVGCSFFAKPEIKNERL